MGVRIRFGEDQTSLLALIGVVVIFLGFWYFTIYNRPITNYPTPTPDTNVGVVAFGDSLAAGVGARQNGGFISILSQELGIEITNLAQAGAGAHDIWRNIDSVVDASPRVVILTIGTSDAVVPITPSYQVESRLERIVSTLHEAGSAVIILETASHAYGNMYRDIAYAQDTALVKNVLKPLRGKERYMFDEVHPNDAGHELIAEHVAPTLRYLLNQYHPIEGESDTSTARDNLLSRLGLL